MAEEALSPHHSQEAKHKRRGQCPVSPSKACPNVLSPGFNSLKFHCLTVATQRGSQVFNTWDMGIQLPALKGAVGMAAGLGGVGTPRIKV